MPLTDPAFTSPKRKRDDRPPHTKRHSPTRLNTTIPNSGLEDEEEAGTGSPRTHVAYRFKGLQIEGSRVPKFELGDADTIRGEETSAKKVKVLEEGQLEIPETPQMNMRRSSPVFNTNASISTTSEGLPVSGEIDPVTFNSFAARSSASSLARAYPSINRLADSKSRDRKRMNTPPRFAESHNADIDPGVTIIDPERAALTWHDDEITGHDPTDPDDDGEGINGIGFKPTPAIAYARAERRRKQLADYRSRESKEARAKRNERRRGSPGSTSASKEDAARRVRFIEAEANSMITTS